MSCHSAGFPEICWFRSSIGMNNGLGLKYLQDRAGRGCGARLPWVSAVPAVAEVSLGQCQGSIRLLLQSCGPAAASLQMLKGKERERRGLGV